MPELCVRVVPEPHGIERAMGTRMSGRIRRSDPPRWRTGIGCGRCHQIRIVLDEEFHVAPARPQGAQARRWPLATTSPADVF
ncbi:hypothetical protein G3I59_25295 [Amycolatopsis rubida]|uniref:Uncharacterized protein n=1 Tax=Amycolatopsis rubida TaxID=112413 RepID=A0ABX0BT80_9PSEU|nr:MULTISPECIES: hypothetical protein [Amycolatopsis]MYW93833.1 hypothetical protein [Amycolatopsis rubida]NEC58822.1 hypothetical protein [Amycolatopsis rubida]